MYSGAKSSEVQTTSVFVAAVSAQGSVAARICSATVDNNFRPNGSSPCLCTSSRRILKIGTHDLRHLAALAQTTPRWLSSVDFFDSVVDIPATLRASLFLLLKVGQEWLQADSLRRSFKMLAGIDYHG